jgi:hypothetical protein
MPTMPEIRRGIRTVDEFEGSCSGLRPKWYSVAEVADLLGYVLSKTKLLIATE